MPRNGHGNTLGHTGTDKVSDNGQLGETDRAMDYFERGFYANNDYTFFAFSYLPHLREIIKTERWKELAAQPRFRAWQAEHDHLAAEFANMH